MKILLTPEQIERIESFYKPKSEFGNLYFFPEGERRFVPFINEPYYLTFGGEKNKETALEVIPTELYYHFAREIYEAKIPDKRSMAYLASIKEKIGLLGFEILDQDSYIDKADEKINVWMNSHEASPVSIKKEENRYVAEFWERGGIDSYTTTVLFFKSKPGKQDIISANSIIDVEFFLVDNPKAVYFTCRDCGRRTHWLDGDGKSIQEKWLNFKQNKECQDC